MKLKDSDKKGIATFYNNRFDIEGESIKSVGWKDKETQFLRFQMLFKNYNPKGKTILDVGCGFGDLIEYLDEITGGDFKYIRIDISSKLVEVAENKNCRDNCKFYITDIFDERIKREGIDFAVESGMLSYKTEDNESYAQAVIERMFTESADGAALNFLTSYVDFVLDKNYHFSPEKVFSWGRKLTRFLSINHDYPLWEFTLTLLKETEGVKK